DHDYQHHQHCDEGLAHRAAGYSAIVARQPGATGHERIAARVTAFVGELNPTNSDLVHGSHRGDTPNSM
ncbi:MAG TPA: hypothetical protein VK427_27865, partial [Kofleriaceae bacterium]|nr:hypothetical protein [Kofleriaceae bacterium]